VLLLPRPVNSAFHRTGTGSCAWLKRPDAPRLHRHLAMPDRRAEGQARCGINDGVGVQTIVAIEIIDGAGLAEFLDAERLDAMAVNTAEPRQCRRMSVDHRDEPADRYPGATRRAAPSPR